jgi:hypothetical protein
MGELIQFPYCPTFSSGLPASSFLIPLHDRLPLSTNFIFLPVLQDSCDWEDLAVELVG